MLPFGLYARENWSVTVRKENKLMLFRNKML